MASNKIPNELFRLILGHLFDLDICSFYVARRTCKAFDDNATDLLATDVANHTSALHGFLMSKFAALIDTSTVPSFQVHDGVKDCLIPFRALPWAADAERRAKFLYPQASWRGLPLSSSSGNIIHELQVVQVQTNEYGDLEDFNGHTVLFPLWHADGGGDSDSYTFEDLCAPHKGVTIGWLYDIILSHMSFYPHPLGKGWKILFDSRVSNPVQFSEAMRRFRLRDKVVTKEEIDAMIVKTERCAVLFEFGGGYSKTEEGATEEAWVPGAVEGDAPITTPF